MVSITMTKTMKRKVYSRNTRWKRITRNRTGHNRSPKRENECKSREIFSGCWKAIYQNSETSSDTRITLTRWGSTALQNICARSQNAIINFGGTFVFMHRAKRVGNQWSVWKVGLKGRSCTKTDKPKYSKQWMVSSWHRGLCADRFNKIMLLRIEFCHRMMVISKVQDTSKKRTLKVLWNFRNRKYKL